MIADLSVAQLVIIALGAVAGSLTQSTLGFGFRVVLAPLLAVVAPELLPAQPLLLGAMLYAAMIRRERGGADWRVLPPLLGARVVGTLIALWLLVVLSSRALDVLFGAVIVTVVLLSATRPSVTPTLPARLVGAAASGLFSTTASIGGPPMALVYQSRPGAEIRATLSMFFVIGTCMSLVALIPAGRISWEQVLLAVLLLVPTAIGFAISGPVARVLEGRWLRLAILAFAAVGGVLAIARGLSG